MIVNISDYKKNTPGRDIKVSISNDDTYSLDYTLAEVILPALKKYKYNAGNRVIWTFPDIEGDAAQQRMNEILNKMILSFELILKDTFGRDDEIQEGLELFGKYYRALWW